MLVDFIVIVSDPYARKRGEKNLIGYGKCDDDFNRLVHSATHHPHIYPDVIEVYDSKGVKLLKLYECDSGGSVREMIPA